MSNGSTSVERLKVRLAEVASLPDESARSLPAEFYTSPEFHELELARLRGHWMCVGHVGEVREAGDFVATELLGEQLLIVRGADEELRVLSNVCRHRGNQVAEGAGNSMRMRCAYHHWTYDTGGALVVAPHMDERPTFDKADCSLPQFRHEVWNGWLFVNLDGQAAALATQLQGLDAVVANYHPADRYLVFLEEVEWQCNWKALFENFMEGYHLSALHPETLHPITPTRLCKKMVSGDAWTGYHAYYDPAYPPRGPFHEDLTEDERNNSPMYGIFPNLVVGMATNFTLFMILRPHGVDKVRIRWGVTGLQDAPESPAVTEYVNLCRAFNAEDEAKLATLQIALRTKNFDGGPLAPDDYEGPIWDFIKFLHRALG